MHDVAICCGVFWRGFWCSILLTITIAAGMDSLPQDQVGSGSAQSRRPNLRVESPANDIHGASLLLLRDDHAARWCFVGGVLQAQPHGDRPLHCQGHLCGIWHKHWAVGEVRDLAHVGLHAAMCASCEDMRGLACRLMGYGQDSAGVVSRCSRLLLQINDNKANMPQPTCALASRRSM